MSTPNDPDHHNHTHAHGHVPHPPKHRRDWRKIHHSPLFWVGAAMFLAAISIYVLSQDLSWRPRIG